MNNFFTENRVLYRNAPSESGSTSDLENQAHEIETVLQNATESAEKKDPEISHQQENTRSQVQKNMNAVERKQAFFNLPESMQTTKWRVARVVGAAVFSPLLIAELGLAAARAAEISTKKVGVPVVKFGARRIGAVTKTAFSGAREIAGSLAMAPLRVANAGINTIGAVKNVTWGTTKKIASLVPGILNLATLPAAGLGISGAEYINSTFKNAQGNWSKSGGESYKSAGNNFSQMGSRLGESIYDAKNIAVNIPSTGLQMASELVKPANNFTQKVEGLENTIVQSQLPKKIFSTDPEKNKKFFSVPNEKLA